MVISFCDFMRALSYECLDFTQIWPGREAFESSAIMCERTNAACQCSVCSRLSLNVALLHILFFSSLTIS